MAYDPKDPADKKIVDKLIADALEEAETEHEAGIAGLKTKNKELIADNRKLKADGPDAAAVERLEAANEKLTADLKTATKELGKVTKLAGDHEAVAKSELAANRKLIVENGLTTELLSNKVPEQFLPAVTKLLEGQVTIKVDGENRVAMVGDKSLGDFVKAWSLSDAGKHFVSATVNGGGAAPGSKAPGTPGKTMTRTAWDAADQLTRSTFSKEGGQVTD